MEFESKRRNKDLFDATESLPHEFVRIGAKCITHNAFNSRECDGARVVCRPYLYFQRPHRHEKKQEATKSRVSCKRTHYTCVYILQYLHYFIEAFFLQNKKAESDDFHDIHQCSSVRQTQICLEWSVDVGVVGGKQKRKTSWAIFGRYARVRDQLPNYPEPIPFHISHTVFKLSALMADNSLEAHGTWKLRFVHDVATPIHNENCSWSISTDTGRADLSIMNNDYPHA